MPDALNCLEALTETTAETLREIVRRHGTPTYAFDGGRLRIQVEKLGSHLPSGVEILYSLKANASLGICDVLAKCGIGADVASAGELATALEAGFPTRDIFVAGPFKLPETVSRLRQIPEATVSVDSPSELKKLADEHLSNPILLRLRPDFGSCAVVPAGSGTRFGFTDADLARCRDSVGSCGLNVIGFHVFAGSQVLKAESVIEHLKRSLDLSLRAAELLGIEPRMLNLGGGFGVPYGPDDEELDLRPIGDELAAILERTAPCRLALELGRYLVAQAGWYLTSVVGHQTHQGRRAVIVDGGTHQRGDMCGLNLRTDAKPPMVLDGSASRRVPTDVLGCLSLPDDVLAESKLLPELSPGDVLGFSNAGAYGLWSSPALFHGSPLPAEVAFDGTKIQVMRERRPARSILDDQMHVVDTESAPHSDAPSQ
jgi:diaminopimelate decarboxylase